MHKKKNKVKKSFNFFFFFLTVQLMLRRASLCFKHLSLQFCKWLSGTERFQLKISGVLDTKKLRLMTRMTHS